MELRAGQYHLTDEQRAQVLDQTKHNTGEKVMKTDFNLTDDQRAQIRDWYNDKVKTEFNIDLSLDRHDGTNLMDEFTPAGFDYHHDQYFYIREDITKSGEEEIFSLWPEIVGRERKVPYERITEIIGIENQGHEKGRVSPFDVLKAIIDHGDKFYNCPDENQLVEHFADRKANVHDIRRAVVRCRHESRDEKAFTMSDSGTIEWTPDARERIGFELCVSGHREISEGYKPKKKQGESRGMERSA